MGRLPSDASEATLREKFSPGTVHVGFGRGWSRNTPRKLEYSAFATIFWLIEISYVQRATAP